MKTIVVGIDGSDESKAAFRFAVQEGEIHAAKVRAVAAWHVPVAVYTAAWAPPADVANDFEADARRTLEDVIADAEGSGVEIESAVREGHPSRVLLEEAEQADQRVPRPRSNCYPGRIERSPT